MVSESERFVRVLVDASGGSARLKPNPAAAGAMDRFDVHAYPTILFLDSSGQEVDRFGGCRGPAFVLAMLREVGERTRGARAVRITVESAVTARAPKIDGIAEGVAWSRARATRIMVKEVSGDQEGRGATVTIKSIRTSTHIYFLVTWADATHDATHKTWVWNVEKSAYEPGSDREDVLALAFEHTGVFDADMLSGAEAVWDVWQWKSARTDPAGYAMDKTHRLSKTQPTGKAKSFAARDGSTIWISRPEDAGESPEKSRPAPVEHVTDRAPGYVAGTPDGSAADVSAKGVWRNGRWTVEFARRLSTGHADDTAFDPGRTYRFGVAVLDREEHVHHSPSRVIELTFVPASEER